MRTTKLVKRLLAEQRFLVGEIQMQLSEQQLLAHIAGEDRASSPAENSTELLDEESTLTMEGELEEMLSEVNHALHKLHSGTYGICDSCGLPIPPERLEARPQATLCVACKTREEHAHAAHAHALVGAHH